MAQRSKANAQRRHAKRRMFERFGIVLTDELFRKIIRDVQGGKAKFVERQTLRVCLWEIEVEGALMWVAYDNRSKEIATVLRPHHEESLLDLLIT